MTFKYQQHLKPIFYGTAFSLVLLVVGSLVVEKITHKNEELKESLVLLKKEIRELKEDSPTKQSQIPVEYSPANIKIGIVDMNRVFTEYNKTKRAQADYLVVEKNVNKELEDRMSLLKKEVEKVNELNAELEKTELTGAALLAKKKEQEESIAKAKKMDDEISEFRASKQKKFQDEFLEKRKEIIGEITKVIDEQTKLHGFELVLDQSGLSAGAVPVVLYARPEFDVSNDIIAILNKKDAAKGGAK